MGMEARHASVPYYYKYLKSSIYKDGFWWFTVWKVLVQGQLGRFGDDRVQWAVNGIHSHLEAESERRDNSGSDLSFKAPPQII